MKRFLLIGLTLLSLQASAQVGVMGLTYRDGDPFVFCRYGLDVKQYPDRCWWPIAPYTGAFMLNPICRPPNPYGKDWTSDDTNSFQQYLRICPVAIKSGQWKGAGDGTQSPSSH